MKTNRQRATVQQSGVLAYRRRSDRLQVLLITSRDTGRWVPPKGHIAPGLTPRESADKEAFEEAGVVGVIERRPLGYYHYRKSARKGGHMCRVELYALKVERMARTWPEKAVRTRKWMSPRTAAAAVWEAELGALILEFGERMRKAAPRAAS